MKFFNVRLVFAAILGLLIAGTASAVSVYDPITTAVDWSAVGTAVIAVAALVAAVLVTMRGVKFVLRAIRS
jgi:predicted porin